MIASYVEAYIEIDRITVHITDKRILKTREKYAFSALYFIRGAFV